MKLQPNTNLDEEDIFKIIHKMNNTPKQYFKRVPAS